MSTERKEPRRRPPVLTCALEEKSAKENPGTALEKLAGQTRTRNKVSRRRSPALTFVHDLENLAAPAEKNQRDEKIFLFIVLFRFFVAFSKWVYRDRPPGVDVHLVYEGISRERDE